MKTLYQILTLLLVLAITSCSSLKTSYDYDRDVDFSAYKTYQFAEGVDEIPLNDLNKGRLLKAIATQMKVKGFTEAQNPDVVVDLYLTAQQKQTATATTTGMGGMGGYGRRGWGMGGGMTTTHVNYSDYTVGTLIVSLADASKQQLVWQGRAEKTISEGATPEKREKNINNAAAKIFSKYPPK